MASLLAGGTAAGGAAGTASAGAAMGGMGGAGATAMTNLLKGTAKQEAAGNRMKLMKSMMDAGEKQASPQNYANPNAFTMQDLLTM